MPGTNELRAVPDQVVAPLEGHIFSLDHVVAQERIVVPDSWKEARYVTFQAFGEDVWLLFGDSAVAATVNTRSVVTTGVMAAANGVAWQIAPGIPENIIVPLQYLDDSGTLQDVTHFSHISDTGAAGHWQARVSST